MITFKPIIIPNNRRKDGTYPVKIRVTYKGVVRRLPTTLICKPSDLTRTLKIKSPDILTRAEVIIGQMRDAVKELSPFVLEDKDVDWVVAHIKQTLTGESFHLDFFDWCDSYVATKGASTARSYIGALNAFERFLGVRECDINDISRSMLLEFMEMVDNEPKMYFDQGEHRLRESASAKLPKGASTRHLAKLEHMFNKAKDKFNDEDAGRILIPRSPFARIQKTYPVSRGQGNIGRDVMQRMISYETEDKVMRTALDVFIVSFGLMGANMADIYNATRSSVKGDTWTYFRQKTSTRRADKAEMRVEIPHQLTPYLERLKGKGSWWLNGLHEFASNKDFATQRVNRLLERWCEENEVERFTFYAGRHTWASLCRKDCGVDKSTIDDCLGHIGDFQVTDIYAERAWNLMTQANEKVLSLFTW